MSCGGLSANLPGSIFILYGGFDVNVCARQKTKRYRYLGLSIIGGILDILGGLGLLALGGVASEVASEVGEYSWVTPLAYGFIALGVVAILAAILILMYKRIGLIVGGALYLIGLILTVIEILAGVATLNVTTIINVVIALAILYYIYIYLTREPEKSFFS